MHKPFAVIDCHEDWLTGRLDLFENGTTSCESARWYAEDSKVVISNGEHILILDAPTNYKLGDRHAVEQLQMRHEQGIRRANRLQDRERRKKESRERSSRIVKVSTEVPCIYRPANYTSTLTCGGCPGAKPRLFICGHPESSNQLCLIDGNDRQIETAKSKEVLICAACDKRQESES